MHWTGAALCLLLPLTVAVGSGPSADDASALLQGRTALAATTEESADVEALRSLLVTVQSDLTKRFEGTKSGAHSGHVALSTVQPVLRRATRHLAGAMSNATRGVAPAQCRVPCIIAIVLDSMAILFEGGLLWTGKKMQRCELPVLMEWWIIGLIALTQDQMLTFPEAVTTLAQSFTGVGGVTVPTTDGLKLFHGLHGILGQMGLASVAQESMAIALSAFGSSGRASVVCLAVMIAAATLWFTSDLLEGYKGDGSSYPTWWSALMDGFYMAIIKMTTTGDGNFPMKTDWAKILSPVGIPMLNKAWGSFSEKLGEDEQSDKEEDAREKEDEQNDQKENSERPDHKVSDLCKCFGKNICSRR